MKSVLVIGMGTIGIYLARKMQDLGNEVMIADKDEELIQELSPEFNDAFCGDCSADGILKSIGVNTFDYIELTSEYSIFEIPVVSSWVGKKVMDVDVRRKHKINIIAVKNDNELNLNLGGDYVFDENDHLVVLGKSSDVFSVASDVKRPSR